MLRSRGSIQSNIAPALQIKCLTWRGFVSVQRRGARVGPGGLSDDRGALECMPASATSDPMASVHELGATGERGSIGPVRRRVGRAWPGILGVALLVALLVLLLLAMHQSALVHVRLHQALARRRPELGELPAPHGLVHVRTRPRWLRILLGLVARGMDMATIAAPDARNDARPWPGRSSRTPTSSSTTSASRPPPSATAGTAWSTRLVMSSPASWASRWPRVLPVRTSVALATVMGIVAGWVISGDSTIVSTLAAPFDLIGR